MRWEKQINGSLGDNAWESRTFANSYFVWEYPKGTFNYAKNGEMAKGCNSIEDGKSKFRS